VKIALVSPYDWLTPGGVNGHLGQLMEEFIERGHDVRVMAPASGAVRDPRVEVMGRPISVPASGSTARISLNPAQGRRVKRFLEEERFDVVHVHEPLMPVLPIQVLRQSKAANDRVINVGTFHARKDGGNRLYGYGRRLLKRWFRELDGKIAVSPPAAQYVGKYFPGFYNVIPNGLDLERFDDRSLAPIPEFDDDMVNILYVGRAEKRKGLAYLIRAFGVVNARDPKTRLIIVGPDSRTRRRYEESVRRSGRRNVHFVVGPSNEELPRYHRTADIFCSPALGHESQGYVILEAMAANLPVVASNIEGYASVITHDVDGLLVRPKDTLGLADALTQLVRDEPKRRALAAAGRVRVEDYSWPRVTQQVLSYYERLLDQHQTWEQARARARLRRLMRA
jgi:phosphatidylinositol alpha-mannosyltransferase